MTAVRHVVMFEFKAGTTDVQISAIRDALDELPRKIALIERFQVSADLGISEGNGDLVVMVDFASASDYRAYAAHPDHRAFVQEVLRPHLERRMAVQFELAPGAG